VIRGTEERKNDGAAKAGSYLEAVQPEMQGRTEKVTSEQARLRELCMQPATPTSKLRARTADETAALLMILNHEIEVPLVPPFLVQSMEPGELAVFEDLFKALEYSIYAHIAPGQRFFSNMTMAAILAQIHCGAEAAPAHQLKIDQFKRELSRISMDMRKRVLKVTFKGRTAAAQWAGWQVPLASTLLTLGDYDMIRERATRTDELIMLDYYSFAVEARSGAVTSRDMYKMLAERLGLKVQAMHHTTSPTLGMQYMQWQVRVCATECPACIDDKGYIVMGEVEVVIHHAGTHVDWPCRTCLSPAHSTRFCTVAAEMVDTERTKYTCTVQCVPPGEATKRKGGRKVEAQLSTIEQLERLLRSEGRKRHAAAATELTVAEGQDHLHEPTHALQERPLGSDVQRTGRR
jgi:hypothetical protein